MQNFYERLAIYRKHLKCDCKREYNEIISICEALYDVASSNKEAPETLPKKFYIYNMKTDHHLVQYVLKELGFIVKRVSTVHYSTADGYVFYVEVK